MHSLGVYVTLAAGLASLAQCHPSTASNRSFAIPDTVPVVTLANGTYTGVYNAQYDQDFFLGLPYSQPPIGDLRLRTPVGLNKTWEGAKSAVSFSPECVQYGEATPRNQSEDCLTLNIVRPAGARDLPVAVWIHGGSYTNGGNALPQYNMSFIVHNSVKSGNPMIGININYRLGGFGFLWGKEVSMAGLGNLGYRDQRLALHWIQENIAKFGGDPKRVTIFGESTGAASVGAHLTAYGGRDDKLFRAVIAQSGSPQQYARYNTFENTQASYDLVVSKAGCSDTKDTLQCLRILPFSQLNDVLNSTASAVFYMPSVDGDFVTELGSTALKSGKFVKVPLLIGTNTDEATGYMFDLPLNTNANFSQFVDDVAHVGLNDTIHAILYPDIPEIGLPYSYGTGNERPTGELLEILGSQYKRGVSFYSDFDMHNNRRAATQAWATYKTPIYSYRFNVIPEGTEPYMSVFHSAEIAWVFNNINGDGYDVNPFGSNKQYVATSKLMTRMWSSFVTHLDPNYHGESGAATWPKYSNSLPENFVFDANITSFIESDIWRAEAINYMIEVSAERYGR